MQVYCIKIIVNCELRCVVSASDNLLMRPSSTAMTVQAGVCGRWDYHSDSLAMGGRAEVHRHTVEARGEVRAVIKIETAQKKLVGLT